MLGDRLGIAKEGDKVLLAGLRLGGEAPDISSGVPERSRLQRDLG